MLLPARHRWLAWLILVTVILYLGTAFHPHSRSHVLPPHFHKWTSSWSKAIAGSRPNAAQHPQLSPGEDLLPADYYPKGVENEWCEERYGRPFLENARDERISYCDSDSQSDLFCHWSITAHSDNGVSRDDAFCFGRRAVYDAKRQKFRLSCREDSSSKHVRQQGSEEDVVDYDVDNQRSLLHLPTYWYETGPGLVMRRFVDLDKTQNVTETNRTTILSKREGSTNVWHSLMEIMSLSLSLDILQISTDPDTNEPMLTAKDGQYAQVVLLDDIDDGPYISLWQLFAKLPVRRLAELGPDEPPTNIVLPLAGGSNAMWQADWVLHQCFSSLLVDTFVHRVLAHYDIPKRTYADDVRITFVDRAIKRKLLKETNLLEQARKDIPHIAVTEVDFAEITFREQLELIQNTDLLVGVHGAALTHTLFLPPGSATLEIIPPGFFHKGFRNAAQITGKDYFSMHAESGGEASDEDWQNNNVTVNPKRLVAALQDAVWSLYNKGGRSMDVI